MGPPVGHGVKLAKLRQKMKSERIRVIEYLDNKMETEILQDVAEFWVRQEKRVLMKEESQKGWKMFASKFGKKKIEKTPKRKSKSDIYTKTSTLKIQEILPKNSEKRHTSKGLITDWWGSDLDEPTKVKVLKADRPTIPRKPSQLLVDLK